MLACPLVFAQPIHCLLETSVNNDYTERKVSILDVPKPTQLPLPPSDQFVINDGDFKLNVDIFGYSKPDDSFHGVGTGLILTLASVDKMTHTITQKKMSSESSENSVDVNLNYNGKTARASCAY